ncbi:MAG: pyruvoyl-dependent arginine decarboxylase [archaeon]|nr:pyruvoyl-dependent arginine decarboxylase [archaeon]
MNLVPTRFFVSSGSAVSNVSDLNAFDKALINTGIGEQNLVLVSSIIPENAKQIDRAKLPMGAITYCVLSQMRGFEGETISAGIAYAYRGDNQGGYVAESHLHGSGKSLKIELQRKIEEIAKTRRVEIADINFVIEELEVPANHYGCCIASLVFTDYDES